MFMAAPLIKQNGRWIRLKNLGPLNSVGHFAGILQVAGKVAALAWYNLHSSQDDLKANVLKNIMDVDQNYSKLTYQKMRYVLDYEYSKWTTSGFDMVWKIGPCYVQRGSRMSR